MNVRTLVAALVAMTSVGALAQTPGPKVDLEELYLDPAGLGTLTVGSGETLKQGKFRVGAALGYQYGHLQYSTATTAGDVVLRDRLDAQLFGAVGVTDWLEVGATIPVIIQQFTAKTPFDIAPAGLGTPQIHARFGLLDERRPLTLSLGFSAGLPLGSSVALSNQGFWVVPRLNLGHRFGLFTLMGEVGATIRNNAVSFESFGGSYWDYVGNSLHVSAALRTNSTAVRGELSVRVSTPLQAQGWLGVEGLLGLRVPIKQTEVFVELGPGFGGGPNTPGFRLYAGANFGNVEDRKKRCVEGEPYELTDCPDLDRDGDGIKNGVDLAPLAPEDKDGFQDEDGAPDPDNDQDGVLDGDDQCPNEKGPLENHGCPDVDSDHDGIVDRLDKCPQAAEDLDGFEDDDGCPDLDNDGDGVEDAKDQCPNEKGIVEEQGCPAKDTDGDTVPNHLDNCPDVKGVPENAGCPAAEKQLVVITKEQLRILEQVRFATAKAAVLPPSYKLLDQVAKVLKTQARIKLVRIEGHTDNVGTPAVNMKLSQGRADSVRDYLLKKGGVPAERLKAVGFGQDRPLESNSTARGREANRRVEFNIVEQE